MEKVKVLLVDDKKENLFSLSSLLAAPHLEIFQAQSGADALSLMVDYDFALAILDVQMPEMDGFELAELMRGTEKTQGIPIIFVTAASPASGFAFKGYESGAVDFLYKPIDTVMLKSKVQVFTQLEIQKMQLRKAKAVAENANQLKSAFLANMSHELRTPLGALLGFAELLEDDSLSSQDKKTYVQTIKRNGKALIHLIDDILDLSKVEAGYLEVEKENVSPKNIIEEVISLLNVSAKQKNIEIDTVISKDLPNVLLTDAKRLRQILMNIIGNALKFTEKGFVSISVSAESINEDSSKVFIRVKDSGIGISPAAAQKLFKPFIQGDSSTIRKFGGTGLGLALSKKLANLLGGDITLEESSPDKGSTFLITFTALKAKEAQKAKSKIFSSKEELQKKLNGLKILIVEDSTDNQVFMDVILSRRGAKVEFANNGLEGFEKAMKNTYDLILMDIQMPIQDGYATVQQLRDKKCKLPIIALTAHAMAEEKDKCLRMGFNDFLSKPIDQAKLVEKIHYHAQQLGPIALGATNE